MNRPKRTNAGNRMAKVMEEKECTDEFYKTNYGGFQETDSDNEFQAEEGVEGDDTVDSDFSIDEAEESLNESGEVNGEGKRPVEDDEEVSPSKKPKLKNSTEDGEEDGSGEENCDTTQEADESQDNESADESINKKAAEESVNKIAAEESVKKVAEEKVVKEKSEEQTNGAEKVEGEKADEPKESANGAE